MRRRRGARAIRRHQLRGDSGQSAGKRALRLREGRLYRRREDDAGQDRTANNGTLMLDEIGDLPHSLQAKLLRFLQERVIERIGGRQEIPVNVRIVCATHQNLKNLISEGRFREDLYYRLAEIVVNIPPLRARIRRCVPAGACLRRRFAAEHNRGAMTCARMPCGPSKHTPGRATCANWKTASSAR
jgi:transcriptional regulator of aromatic amino acid metabolism